MKKIMRIAALMMVFIFMCLSAPGCGKQSEPTGADSNGENNVSSGTESDSNGAGSELEPVTLHFYFFDGKKSETDHVWEEIANYVNNEYGLNVKFDIQFIAGTDYKDKMLVKAAAGDKWDLNFEGDWVSYYQMINKDAYMALDELLPVYAPELYKTYEESGVLEAAKNKGKVVALPWTMRMTSRPFFQWRGDLAEKAGIDTNPSDIKTIEDIDILLGQLKEAYPDRYIIEASGLDAFMTTENLLKINNHFAVRLDDEELKVVPLETTNAYREFARYGKKWQDAGYIWKDVLTDKLDPNQLIDQGRLITKWGTYEFCRTNRSWVEEAARWDYGQLYEENLFANRTPLANCLCIPETAENPERTLMFLELLHKDKKLYDLVHYGIEGLTYELDGDNAVYPDGMNSANSNYMDWGGRWAMWDPSYMRPDRLYGPSFWIEEAEFVDSSDKNIISPLEGFNFNTEAVKTEMTQITQIHDEAHKMISVGLAGDPDAAVDKLIQDRKNAGVEKVAAELQSQIDAFLANKE